MNTTHRKPLIALIALSAAFAMPLAFAQETQEPQPEPTPTEEPAPQPTENATGSSTQPSGGAVRPSWFASINSPSGVRYIRVPRTRPIGGRSCGDLVLGFG